MKVDKINQYKEQFLDKVEEEGLYDHRYRYEVQKRWQSEWDIEAIDLTSMYDNVLKSKISGRLWGGSRSSAKESMLAMITGSKEFMRSAFRDLFSHEKDLGLRCDRFEFYCKEAINQVTDPKIIQHRHNRVLMNFYLAMENPAHYCLYDYKAFLGMMEKLESRNIPTEVELERYQKSMRAIHGILQKDDRWVSVIKEAVGEYFVENSILVTNEYAHFVARSE